MFTSILTVNSPPTVHHNRTLRCYSDILWDPDGGDLSVWTVMMAVMSSDMLITSDVTTISQEPVYTGLDRWHSVNEKRGHKQLAVRLSVLHVTGQQTDRRCARAWLTSTQTWTSWTSWTSISPALVGRVSASPELRATHPTLKVRQQSLLTCFPELNFANCLLTVYTS